MSVPIPSGATDAEPPQQQGCLVEPQLVHEVRGEERRAHGGPALHEHVGGAELAEGLQRLGRVVGCQVDEPSVVAGGPGPGCALPRRDTTAHARVLRHRLRGHHRAQRLPLDRRPVGVPGREGRIVRAQRATAHQDRVHPRAQRVALGPGGRAGDPLARAVRGGHPAVEALGELEGHERPTTPLRQEPAFVQVTGRLGQQPVAHVHPVRGEVGPTAACGIRGVRHREDHAGNPGRKDRGGARASAPGVVARFEGHQQGGVAQRRPRRAGLPQHVHLGVVRARPAVVAHVQQRSGGVDESGAHHGVRAAHTPLGRSQCRPHGGCLGGSEVLPARGVVTAAGTRPRGVVVSRHRSSSPTERWRSGKPVPIVALLRCFVFTRHHTKKPARVNAP